MNVNKALHWIEQYYLCSIDNNVSKELKEKYEEAIDYLYGLEITVREVKDYDI